MTVHAALEGGAEAIRDPELAGFSRDVVGHLERRHASELARWLRLVDAEAAATATRRATPWIPVRDVRRRGGFALDGFRLAETGRARRRWRRPLDHQQTPARVRPGTPPRRGGEGFTRGGFVRRATRGRGGRIHGVRVTSERSVGAEP